MMKKTIAAVLAVFFCLLPTAAFGLTPADLPSEAPTASTVYQMPDSNSILPQGAPSLRMVESTASVYLARGHAVQSDNFQSIFPGGNDLYCYSDPAARPVLAMPTVSWDLMLLNKSHSLPSSFRPVLQTVGSSTSYKSLRAIQLNPAVAAMVKLMSAQLKKENLGINYLVSGYRTIAYQKNLFNRYLKQNHNNLAFVNSFSALPGQSEHHTGYAVDFSTRSGSLQLFGKSAQYQWIKNNCYKYGFIERYPAGKTALTRYIWESWHYRYVGTPYAAFLSQNNLSLEEFYAALEKGPLDMYGKKLYLVDRYDHLYTSPDLRVKTYYAYGDKLLLEISGL